MNKAAQLRSQAQERWPGATILARGKKYIKHQHPSNPNAWMLDTQLGAIHYGAQADQEIDTAWEVSALQPWLWQMIKADYNAYAMPGNPSFLAGQIIRFVDPETNADITFQPQALQWTNNLDQIQTVGNVQAVSGVTNDNKLQWVGAFGSGLDFEFWVHGERLQKRLTIASLASMPTPTATIINGGNPVLRMQFIFNKSAGVEIWINGQLWNEASNNPIVTNGTVEFKLNGEVKWVFKTAFAYDNEGIQIAPVYKFRKQGANLFVEIRTPWEWLQSATYPIVIDPTLDIDVTASNQDAQEKGDGTGFSSISTAIEARSNTSSALQSNAGIWLDMTGGPDNGDTITVAYLKTTCSNAARDSVHCEIYGNLVTSASNFADEADVTSRTLTTNHVAYDQDNQGLSEVNSPSIVIIVQEIIDQGGYVAGNPQVYMFRGRADTSQPGERWTPDAYDGSAANAAGGHFEWTVAATGNPWYAYAQQ